MKLVILGTKGSILFGRTWKQKKVSVYLDVLKNLSYELKLFLILIGSVCIQTLKFVKLSTL